MGKTFSNSATSQLYKRQLKPYGGDLIFKCNLSVNNLQTTISSQFLTEVIHSWILCKHNENIKVSKQVVWNHLDVCKKNGEAFYFDSWYQKGLQFIEHFYDFRNKKFYDFNYFSALYYIPNSDFLKFNSLKSSMSRNIKAQMEEEDIDYTAPTYFFNKINQNTKLC